MQPNGNMPGAGQPVGPAKPVNPVNPVNPTRPVRPVTPTTPATSASEPTFDNGPSVVDSKGGKKTGWILAVVLLLIVAIGGVGFGVWAMMDGNAQKDALNSQISALKQQNSELQEKLDNGGDTIVNVDTDGDEVNATEYIYVGEWGLKIRKPENWRSLISEYSFSNDYPQAVDTFTIKEVSSSDIANILISNRGEASCDNLAVASDVCFDIDGNNFIVSVNENVSDALKAYFTDAENYSKI